MRLPVAIVSCLLAAPAAAQPAGGQPYRVFFDWAKPELTRDAETTLDEIVAAYPSSRPSRIDVAGHTDRSGSDSVNFAASRRRAEVVKSYLAARGVPAAAIRVSAFGERRPIVPTEDGVREGQNRRVEISFGGVRSASVVNLPIVRFDGAPAGVASLAAGDISLRIDVAGLSAGVHGLHLHAVGRCDPPDFATAGAHWNPTQRQHGRDNPLGPHLGDLPNLVVGADGRGTLTLPVPPGLVDDDGAALVVHASPDDYRTDPSGNSGERIACAAFTR